MRAHILADVALRKLLEVDESEPAIDGQRMAHILQRSISVSCGSIFFVLSSFVASALDLYVSPQGKTGAVGSRTQPLAQLAEARDKARRAAGRESVIIHVAPGTYYLPETLKLEARDSGSPKFPVIYRAMEEGKAVLSGGQLLNLKWQSVGGGRYRANVPDVGQIDQLFVNGERQRMARYPNYDANKKTAAYQGYAADAFSPERAARWSDPRGGYIHAMHSARWGGYHYRITGKAADGSVTYEGGWQNNRQMGMHREFRMVENIKEELDAEGEWFYDATAKTLDFQPGNGVDLSKARIEVVRLRHLIELHGSENAPVRDVRFEGFVLRHAARTFMDTKEPLLRSDWAIYRGGAILLEGTERVQIRDCEFDQVGGNAVFFSNYNRGGLVKGCHIHDVGASGVCFVGDPKAVRAPLFEYGQTQDLSKIDRTPGPIGKNFPANCAVEDCLMHGIGRVERQPAGVQISMAMEIAVRDCSIYDCSRSGINISEGTWGGHLIERCDVFDTVLETHDHGSFNSWGRDRFWMSNHRGVSMPEVKKDPKLPYLDCVKTTVIRDSRWRCDHGWDIDLDDGSSNYEIYRNVMLAGGLKFREGYGRNAYNNVIINNGFHPHVWFDQCDSKFHKNIVMKAHAPIGQPGDWGQFIDHNFFTNPADAASHGNVGADKNSQAGDPQFIDPAKGDFRVKEGSPALAVGFVNFPMDQFGVKKPSLKAIAKTPVIPALAQSVAMPAVAKELPRYWWGAPLHSLQGEEFSAFGTRKEDGGVHFTDVPQGSLAANYGIKKDDLLQKINGFAIRSVDDLMVALAKLGASDLTLSLVRYQKPLRLVVRGGAYWECQTATSAEGLTRIVPQNASWKFSAQPDTGNDPLSVLHDGKLAPGYGPVFANGTPMGCYRADLGSARDVKAIQTWTYHMNGLRGKQRVHLFASNAEDPGWDHSNGQSWQPLTSIVLTQEKLSDYVASSWHAGQGKSLGRYRWILWVMEPISDLKEHSAVQELGVIVGD